MTTSIDVCRHLRFQELSDIWWEVLLGDSLSASVMNNRLEHRTEIYMKWQHKYTWSYPSVTRSRDGHPFPSFRKTSYNSLQMFPSQTVYKDGRCKVKTLRSLDSWCRPFGAIWTFSLIIYLIKMDINQRHQIYLQTLKTHLCSMLDFFCVFTELTDVNPNWAVPPQTNGEWIM